MDEGTLVTILVVALVIVVILLLMRAVHAGRRANPTLTPLPEEARERYIHDWDEIEAKFVDNPGQSVREAEALVLSVMRERGHPLTERDLPSDMHRAHKLATGKGTEGLRQALLLYRSQMEEMLGPEHKKVPNGRRQMA